MSTQESPFIVPAALPAFELAMENAFADFFKLAWQPAGGPLENVRILAGVRDFEVPADQEDPAQSDPAAVKSHENDKAAESLKPVLIFAGSGYRLSAGLDLCTMKVRVSVNLKQHPATTFAAIISHVRAVLSEGYQPAFQSLFNDHTTHPVRLQGVTQPEQPSTNGFAGTFARCEMLYGVSGCLVAS